MPGISSSMRDAGQRLTSLVRMSVNQACGFTALSFAVSMSDARHAQFSAPSSLPATVRFFFQGQYRGSSARWCWRVDLDATVVEEAGEPDPVVETVADVLYDAELRKTRASCCFSQTWSLSTSSLEWAYRAARLAPALCPRISSSI